VCGVSNEWGQLEERYEYNVFGQSELLPKWYERVFGIYEGEIFGKKEGY
jgi:hypothetical protein